MQPPQLSDDQVNCGPDWPDQMGDDGRFISLSTPSGEYDLALIAESHHPRRGRLLQALQKAGLPVAVQQIHQNMALKFYGASAIALNSSMNGDFIYECLKYCLVARR